jgi:hypothetical protein
MQDMEYIMHTLDKQEMLKNLIGIEEPCEHDESQTNELVPKRIRIEMESEVEVV